jgi:hypothetical protein
MYIIHYCALIFKFFVVKVCFNKVLWNGSSFKVHFFVMKKHVVSINKYIFYFLKLTLKNTMIFMSPKSKECKF